MIFSQHIYKGILRVSNGIPSIDIITESGINEEKKEFFYSKNNLFSGDLLEELKKNNFFSNNRNVTCLIDNMLKLNDQAKTKDLDFSIFILHQTEHVKVKNEYEAEDMRKWGFCRLIINNNGQIQYKDILFHNDINKLIDEVVFTYKTMIEDIENVKKTITHQLECVSTPVVFAPGIGGYFVHEVLGHMVEGDYVSKKMSLFGTKYKIGDYIATKILNVIDDPTGISEYIGLSNIDDEGKQIKTIQIIENGKLNSYICDKRSAGILGNDDFSGCARRQSFLFRAIPRMRGTFVQPFSKDVNFNSLIANTENGISLENITMGQANPIDGKFMLYGQGRLIRKGVFSNYVDSIMISGDIISALNNIEAIGDDFLFLPVQCGKGGQFIPVCVGSPSIKVNNLLVLGGSYAE